MCALGTRAKNTPMKPDKWEFQSSRENKQPLVCSLTWIFIWICHDLYIWLDKVSARLRHNEKLAFPLLVHTPTRLVDDASLSTVSCSRDIFGVFLWQWRQQQWELNLGAIRDIYALLVGVGLSLVFFSICLSIHPCFTFANAKRISKGKTESEGKQKKKCARCATCMYKHGVPSIIVGYIGTSKREKERGWERKEENVIYHPDEFFVLLSDEIILIVGTTEENRGHQQSRDRHACRDSYQRDELFSCIDMELSEYERRKNSIVNRKERKSGNLFLFFTH